MKKLSYDLLLLSLMITTCLVAQFYKAQNEIEEKKQEIETVNKKMENLEKEKQELIEKYVVQEEEIFQNGYVIGYEQGYDLGEKGLQYDDIKGYIEIERYDALADYTNRK